MRRLGRVRRRPGAQCLAVAGRAAGGGEQPRAFARRRVHRPARRRRQRRHVAHQGREVRIRDLRRAAVAAAVHQRTVLARDQGGGDPHVARQRGGDLLAERGLVRLQAEAARDGAAARDVPHHVDPAAHAVACFRVRHLVQGLGGHRFQQPEAEHRRRQARGCQQRLGQGAVIEGVQRDLGPAQAHHRAVVQRHRRLAPEQARGGLGRAAEDGVGLDLVAVNRMRPRSAGRVRARQADAHEGGAQDVGVAGGRRAAPVADVAGDARAPVVQRSQPGEARRVRRRPGEPCLPEHARALAKQGAQVLRKRRERLLVRGRSRREVRARRAAVRRVRARGEGQQGKERQKDVRRAGHQKATRALA